MQEAPNENIYEFSKNGRPIHFLFYI